MAQNFERWVIPLEDGDELWCRYYQGESDQTVLFFHGLAGCVESNYMQVCGREALEMGHSVLLVNHRGAGEGFAYAKGLYHSGAIEDARQVVRFTRERRPKDMITAAGFSLSANLLLNLVGQGGSHLPDRVVAVNPPIDLHATARCLLEPRNFVYDQKFVRDLRKQMWRKFESGLLASPPDLPRFCRLVDFDERITAPLCGFSSRDDYYTRCSSAKYAEGIKTPTLILMAEDDPFIPTEPFRKAKFGPAVRVQIEKRGGHVGYLGVRSSRWLGAFFHEALN